MSDAYQWTGSSDADLGVASNWFDTTNPGPVQEPGPNDVAIIQVGQGLFGTLSVNALDIVQSSGAPTLSIVGSSTQVTAGSVGLGGGVTLDTGATLQAGTVGIDGDGTVVTVQNGASLYDYPGDNADQFMVGASTGSGALQVSNSGTVFYSASAGTLSLGGVSGSVASFTVSAGGYVDAFLDDMNIGASSGATGIVDVTGANSQFIVDGNGVNTVGDFGEYGGSAQGTVEVTGGAYASMNFNEGMFIGTTAGMAEILVSGTNSAVQAGSYTYIGISGSNVAGEIIVQAGGEFDSATDTYLGNGTITVAGAKSLFTGRILSDFNGTTVQVNNGGQLRVADLEVSGKVAVSAGSVSVRESLTVYAGGQMTGHGTITAASIANGGRMVASGGTLVVGGSITGTGVLQISSGAALTLDNAVASMQNIVFGANAKNLLLADPSGVAAHILDFASGEAIDLLGHAATKLSYAAGALTVSNGSTLVAKLEIKGSYATANFKLASDGHGGSLISYVSAHASHGMPVMDGALHLGW